MDLVLKIIHGGLVATGAAVWCTIALFFLLLFGARVEEYKKYKESMKKRKK